MCIVGKYSFPQICQNITLKSHHLRGARQETNVTGVETEKGTEVREKFTQYFIITRLLHVTTLFSVPAALWWCHGGTV